MLREVVKNPLVESVVLCEIDEVGTTQSWIRASLHKAILVIFPALTPAHISVDVASCVGCH